jgi:hypothetical protein
MDLGQPVDSITPEQVQLAFLKVNWESSDDLIIDKFVEKNLFSFLFSFLFVLKNDCDKIILQVPGSFF